MEKTLEVNAPEETKQESSVPANLASRGMTEKEWRFVRSAIGAAYLLATVADHYVNRSVEILRRRGAIMFRIKSCWNDYTKAFDRFNNELHRDIINDMASNFCKDSDELTELVSNFIFRPEEKWNWEQRYLYQKTQYDMLQKEFDSYKRLHPDA